METSASSTERHFASRCRLDLQVCEVGRGPCRSGDAKEDHASHLVFSWTRHQVSDRCTSKFLGPDTESLCALGELLNDGRGEFEFHSQSIPLAASGARASGCRTFFGGQVEHAWQLRSIEL